MENLTSSGSDCDNISFDVMWACGTASCRDRLKTDLYSLRNTCEISEKTQAL